MFEKQSDVWAQVSNSRPGRPGAFAETIMLLHMKSTVGESLIAFLISAVAAVFAAIAGFFVGVILPEVFLSGEATESALILAPAIALIFGTAVFVFAYRKISSYGESPDNLL